MTGKDRKLSKTTGEVINILSEKNLPHTYDEVFQLVHQYDGDMIQINNFINEYEQRINRA